MRLRVYDVSIVGDNLCMIDLAYDGDDDSDDDDDDDDDGGDEDDDCCLCFFDFQLLWDPTTRTH